MENRAVFGDGHIETILWYSISDEGYRIEFMTESGRYLLVIGYEEYTHPKFSNGRYRKKVHRWYRYEDTALFEGWRDCPYQFIDHIELKTI